MAPDLDGQQTAVIDSRTNQTVGYVFVDVNQEFLSTESGGFLQTMVRNSALGGLLIAIIALGLAFGLLRRIIAPVTALTSGTQAIAEHGRSELFTRHIRIEPCGLDKFLTSEIGRWQPQAEAKQIALKLNLPSNLPTLSLDPQRVRQALSNVIRNASWDDFGRK